MKMQQMPTMGGLECARRIRQDEKDGLITKHLTIIATTANARAEQVQSTYDAGMVSLTYNSRNVIPSANCFCAGRLFG